MPSLWVRRLTLPIAARLAAWLVHPWLPVHLALLAMVLLLPSLGVGWQFDDHVQRFMMVGSAEYGARPMDVFAPLGRGPDDLRNWVELGFLPWWTPLDFRLAFFRPLSAISMWIDYRLWPEIPVLMHLHSLLWYGALVIAAAALYRRLLGATWCAGLASLLYTVDDAHAMPVAWLANRNALLATTFGVASLWAHDRWRRDGWRAGAILSPCLFALGLASAEMALTAGAWLAAYAVFLDRAAWRGRLAALVPHALVFATWATAYRLLGYGTFGSDFYLDPVTSPVAYLGGLAERAPVLLLGQWTPIAADWATLLPGEAVPGLWLAGIAVALIMGVVLMPLVLRDRVARFWMAGMLLSLLPIAAVSPANRLLFFVGLGAMGLMAQLARLAFEAGRRRMLERGIALTLAVSHLVIAPLLTPVLVWSMKQVGERMIKAIGTIPDDPAISGQELVLVNPPDYLMLASPIPAMTMLEGRPLPKRMLVLASGTSPIAMTRVGPDAVRLALRDGLYAGTLGRLFRSRRDPMSSGQRFDTGGMAITIVETNAEGDPVTIDYAFRVPLEHPSLRWLRWDEDRYVPFTPPPVGESTRLPASYGPMDLYRREPTAP